MRAGIPWKKLVVLLAFVAGWGLFFALDGGRYLSLGALKANKEVLLDYTQHHYWPMLAAMAAIYLAATALSIPGAAALSVATGFPFGRWVGTVLIVFSATVGATLVFLAARYVFAEAARRRMGGRAEQLVAGFHRNAFNYLLFLRLVPLFPFWLVNLVPALAGIRLRTYVSATAIGIVPGSFAFANLGQSLGRIESAGDLLSPQTLGAFSLLGVLALVPVLVRKGNR